MSCLDRDNLMHWSRYAPAEWLRAYLSRWKTTGEAIELAGNAGCEARIEP